MAVVPQLGRQKRLWARLARPVRPPLHCSCRHAANTRATTSAVAVAQIRENTSCSSRRRRRRRNRSRCSRRRRRRRCCCGCRGWRRNALQSLLPRRRRRRRRPRRRCSRGCCCCHAQAPTACGRSQTTQPLRRRPLLRSRRLPVPLRLTVLAAQRAPALKSAGQSLDVTARQPPPRPLPFMPPSPPLYSILILLGAELQRVVMPSSSSLMCCHG